MIVTKDTVIFKSSPEHWDKESKGIKPNTVRSMDIDEIRQLNSMDIAFITIINTVTDEKFTRHLSDVTFADINMIPVIIFSWHP